MGDLTAPNVYSIAAHRGFADALVSGLIPRYSDGELGLAKLTLLLPSTRAMRIVTEAFIRHFGANGGQGMLMPRMAVVGDLDLDETLGSLLDPLGASDIPVAVDPTHRWLRLAQLLAEELGDEAPGSAGLMRLARETAMTMDRLLVEDIGPEELLKDSVLDLLGDLSGHWQNSLHLFARVQTRWLAELEARNALDAASRRNRLFDHAAARWKSTPPQSPIVAAGVTSASPALARMLKVVALLPDSAVILPDFDLSMDDAVWEELGAAGGSAADDDTPFQRGDAITHPQYHLKLLLERMGIARGELQPWHRKGLTAASPDRTHAISSLFLPPEASKSWVDLPGDKRRLSGVRVMECANPEEEAQAVALLVRKAVAEPEKRVAVVTPDRGLARRIVQHLRRWHIQADDSAGEPLSQTPAGRLFLLLAEVVSERAAPVPLMALLEHPLVRFENARGEWLSNARAFELALRGPRPAPGLGSLAQIAQDAQVGEWWDEVSAILSPLDATKESHGLAALLDLLATAGEALCGDALWSREDGRSLSNFVEDLRFHADGVGTRITPDDLHTVLRDAMETVAVRPPYGGHPRVAIYGLLESRMSRANLVICAGLNEGSWPSTPSTDPLLAPAVLRALGVPGADFRIGLSAHDLAGAMGAPEVVLSRADRDISGPAIPSRFLLRVKALLGADLIDKHREVEAVEIARALDHGATTEIYSKPEPKPSAEQRKQRISVTALDRLRSDPYQFYAGNILRLGDLDGLDAEPSAAWRGTAAHEILETWHKTGRPIAEVASEVLQQMNAHPLMRSLWQPRLMKALEWVEGTVKAFEGRKPTKIEEWGEMEVRGVTIFGKVDRIDSCDGKSLAIVDYKTGGPPTGKEVEAGYALQLGTLGLMAGKGAFGGPMGTPEKFEYWSLAKSDKSETGFGYIATPLKEGSKRSGILPEDFLPKAQDFLDDALDRWILGDEPFTARLNPDAKVYTTYDQLMRLDEWMGREE
ncbi:PD-(D/E)XK nuclease family protein [Pontixanthobacter aquaemixtae]|uniref:Double-strand break repair protein AddB n=1 Tax=Pontixanthobacter aquaemixtae TaxID=1958940 RepID=A0A844ZQK2_9SPHN|nr:PD-(D/E)XK nuclease family protein [Pontixanthobacter aquaemixtae]MXO90073.1 double-strand break repair protein AddB [Pontixanthobacter aquaemixtae]